MSLYTRIYMSLRNDDEAAVVVKEEETSFSIELGKDFTLMIDQKRLEELHEKIEGALYEESYKDLSITIGHLEDRIKKLEAERKERVA